MGIDQVVLGRNCYRLIGHWMKWLLDKLCFGGNVDWQNDVRPNDANHLTIGTNGNLPYV